MAGFIVSNSFGKFHSETKKFNAPLSGFPGAPQSYTLREMANAYPSIPSFGYPREWAHDDWQGLVIVDNDDEVTLSDGKEYNTNKVDRAFQWVSTGQIGNDDEVILYEDDAFKFKANPLSIVKFRVRVKGKSSAANAYDYVVNVKKGGSSSGQSIPTAAQSSSVSCFSNYTMNTQYDYVDFDVILDGSNSDYISIDMNKVSGKIANFKIVTKCGTWSRINATGSDDPANNDIERVQIKLLSTEATPIQGCTDPQADNYDTNATVNDGSCAFTTATISSFDISPSSMTQGSSAVVSWRLSNGNFSEVKLLENGINIMPDDKKQAQASNITVTPSNIGNNTYKLQVIWNKSNAAQRNSSVKNINVVSPTSYITCTDPNRNKDANQECADCKSGYYLGDDGLCTQCSDPNRKKDSDGRCGDCESGYSLGTDGLCQKSGCMDEDDANYDPDAVIDDASACYGTNGNGENGENEDTNGDNNDSGTTTTSTTTTSTTTTTDTQGDKEESPNLLIPVLLGGAILGGVLLLRR